MTAAITRPFISGTGWGLLRGRTGATADEAFNRLRVINLSEHTKLADVAQHIVDEPCAALAPATRSGAPGLHSQ